MFVIEPSCVGRMLLLLLLALALFTLAVLNSLRGGSSDDVDATGEALPLFTLPLMERRGLKESRGLRGSMDGEERPILELAAEVALMAIAAVTSVRTAGGWLVEVSTDRLSSFEEL